MKGQVSKFKYFFLGLKDNCSLKIFAYFLETISNLSSELLISHYIDEWQQIQVIVKRLIL